MVNVNHLIEKAVELLMLVIEKSLILRHTNVSKALRQLIIR
jgi:hypothetical protein